MKSWLPVLHERLLAEDALIRVAVATVRGSAPREPGASMLIGARRVDGTIGGGQLELKATEIARGMLAQSDAPSRIDRFALGATLGQCCGGAVNLWFERYQASDRELVHEALTASRRREPVVLVTQPQSGRAMRRSLHVISDKNRMSTASIKAGIDLLLSAPSSATRAMLVRADEADAFLERVDPPGLPLWLFGAGHVGKALVNVIAELPFDVSWIDSRRNEFPRALPAHINSRVIDEPDTIVDEAPAQAFFVVMTHCHDLDYAICRRILRRDDFSWAGLIGSETKAACFKVRFGREDISPASVARLISPIGIDGIDSKLPGAIAVSIAAQLLQVAQAAESTRAVPAAPILKGAQAL
jgi:xanthine dehydrogenase accessory factor